MIWELRPLKDAHAAKTNKNPENESRSFEELNSAPSVPSTAPDTKRPSTMLSLILLIFMEQKKHLT